MPAFEHVEGLNPVGRSNPLLWPHLAEAALAGKANPNGYSWVDVSQTFPEHLTLYHDGKIVLTSPANTGIPGRPTNNGTFPVYLRYQFQVMRGTNPNGSTYADPVDMVVGSRVLGSTMNTDGVRNLGVEVFAHLASALTGTRVTDTSSGLRLMRVEVVATVRQTQAQYQTSELLVGAIMAGWKVAEVPTVMRPRRSGQSRKGRNLLYGARYGRVLLGTWWRESRADGGVRQQQPSLLTRLVRCALGSAACLGVSEASLAVLVLLGMPAWGASLAASTIGVVPGYPLNRTWTFGRRGRSSTWKEVLPYWASSLAAALAAAAAVGQADGWAGGVTSAHHDLARSLVDMATYLSVYGSVWFARFVFMDRLLFTTNSPRVGLRRLGAHETAEGRGVPALPGPATEVATSGRREPGGPTSATSR